MALPIFASDPLSSVAYATQEILLVLSLGGLAYLYLAPWVAVAVVVLLAVVVVSYRQVVRAYPSGGGSYEVATRNLGRPAGLVVAGALLVDYVMTVAVSVAAGVDNIISAVPALHTHRVAVNLGFVAFLTAMNLRGVRESGKTFAVPTYLFVVGVLAMIAVGLGRAVAGDPPVAESAGWQVRPEQVGLTGLALALLTLRAFDSGCTALTGVEAISNGVPAFQPPKSGNAARTMATMGALAITMFAGITALALVARVRVAEHTCDLVGFPGDCTSDPQRTVVAQLAAAVFGGDDSVLFYHIQATTALVLILAANTAFNGFPMLGSILAQERYLPRQLHTRGDRLAFSNGIDVAARQQATAVRRGVEAALLARVTAQPVAAESMTRLLDHVRGTFAMDAVALVEDGATTVAHVGVPAGDPVLDVPAADRLRLVAWGPGVFAEDRRVLGRLAAAAARTLEVQRLAAEAARARELAEVDRLRQALLTAVGHDLRTPLTGIKAAVSGLRQPDVGWTAAQRAELLATIEESTDRLDGLVENLLSMSRLRAGAVTVARRPVALDAVVGQALLHAPADGHPVEVDVPDDLPHVRADPGLLEHVIANLVSNAQAASPPCRPVRVHGRADGDRIRPSVVDHGPGVPESAWEHMFEPFHRLDDRATTAGLGLGLAIARGFTEAMDATLTPSGTPGGGLTMTVGIPLAGAA